MSASNVVSLRPEHPPKPDALLTVEQTHAMLGRMGVDYSIHAVRRMAAAGVRRSPGALPFFRGPDRRLLLIWRSDLLKAMGRPDWIDPADQAWSSSGESTPGT